MNTSDRYETFRRICFMFEIASFVTIAICLLFLTVHFV